MGQAGLRLDGDDHLDVGLIDPVERFEDGEVRVLLPLNVLMIPWVTWALKAPPTRTDPK